MNKNIETFITEWQRLYDEYMQKRFPRNENPRITSSKGKKYVKVQREGSVIAFIDATTGDIFMAQSWQSPAKHARGNVNSEQNGIEALNTTEMHPHVRYLK